MFTVCGILATSHRPLAGCLQDVGRLPGRLLSEEANGGVGSRGEDPRLCGVKGHIKHTEVMSDHMTSENLHRNNQRVLQQVTGGEEREVTTVYATTAIL